MSLPRAARELAEKLENGLFGATAGKAVMLTGGPGTGKTSMLDHLAGRADDHGFPCVRIAPTSTDLDGPANALAQGAAGMREQGVNGTLDAIYDPRARFGHKVDALGHALHRLHDALILVDLPGSWSRPSRASADGGATAFDGHRVVREILSQRNGHTVVVASDLPVDRDGIDESFRLRASGGLESLADIDWGDFQGCADSLAARVREAYLRHLTPLELRVAVALSALGVHERLIDNACRGRWAELRRMLQFQLQHNAWLQEAFFVLAHARVRVGSTLLDQLLDRCIGPDEPESRRLLRQVLLMPDGGTRLFHPRLHEVDTPLTEHRRQELAEATNHSLAVAWDEVANRNSWGGVVAWWESLHHWAELGDEERLEQVPDISMWTTLGRRRSLQGDHETAVRAFRRAIELQPEDSYAHEYLAYNLDRVGVELVEAERSFHKAVELDAANPWWNRRLVQALQRRGKIEAAWDAWIATLSNIEEAASPNEWLQRNLHRGVCEGFLVRGQVDRAADVLDSIPREQWISEFEQTWNAIRHRREAVRLDASVFPEDIDFESRWRGPRFDPLRPVTGWFPGRIIAIDDEEVELELAAPPVDGNDPEVFGLVLGLDEFREQAELPARFEPSLDQFVELHVHDDGQSIAVDFARSFEASETRNSGSTSWLGSVGDRPTGSSTADPATRRPQHLRPWPRLR